MPATEALTRGHFIMKCLIRLAAFGFISFGTVTSAFAQGRFGADAAQRAADRIEREAIRRAEHPELYQAVAGKPSETPVPEATPDPAPAAEQAPVAKPAPAPPAQ